MALPTFEEFYSRAKSKYPTASDEAIKAAYSQRTGQDAVFTQGPSFEDFASRAVAKYGPMDPNVLKQAYDARYSTSYLTDLKRAAKRGFGQFGDVVGAGLEAVGADDLGSSVRDYWQETQDENRQSVEGQNRSWYNPAKIVESSVEMGVNMLPTLGIGGGLGTGARLLGAGAKVAGAIGTGAASGVGGVQEALPFYEQMIEQGVDPETARAKAAALGVYVAASSAVPTGRILGRTPGRIKTGLWEAGTETSEETVQALLEGKDPIKATIEGAKAVGPAAFLMGAGLGAGGEPQASATAEEEFRRQAGLEDTPTPEPVSDVAAQVAEIGKTRKGVYLAPGQAGDFQGIKVPVPGGGELLVQNQADAQEALLRFQTEDRQAVLGQFTGAGMQPKPRSDVVVQAMRDGKVIRESVVLPEDAQDTARRFEAELGVPARITTAQEALKRRQDLIQAEGLGQLPKLPKGGIDANRRAEAPGASPEGAGSVEYNPPTDLVNPPRRYTPEKRDTIALDAEPLDPEADNFGLPEPPRTVPDDDPFWQGIPLNQEGKPETLGINTPERQALRQQIVEAHFEGAKSVEGRKPIAYIMGGGGAAGKGTLLKALRKAGLVPGRGAVEINPDDIKTGDRGIPGLPEFAALAKRGDGRGSAVVHEESSTLAKQVMARAKEQRNDIVFDRTLGVLDKGLIDIQQLKDAGYEVRLYGITTTPENALKRAVSRARRMGRWVPFDKLLEAHQGFSGAWERYADQADRAELYDSDTDGAPTRIYKKDSSGVAIEDEGRYNAFGNRRGLNEKARTLRQLWQAQDQGDLVDQGAVGQGAEGAGGAGSADGQAGRLAGAEGQVARTISVPGTDRSFQVRSEIVPLSQLLSSDLEGYDQRKQPRDREGRVALQLQAEDIAAKLNPNLLLDSRSTADGAPVIANDSNTVESGNGRVMALRIAQQKHPEKFAAYQERLRQEGFPVTGDEVLVQRRLTPMTDEEIIGYTQEANARGNASLSATEQAKMDARLLDEAVLTGINSGDMSQAQNVAAISAFFDRLPSAERNALVYAKGKPNAAGERRAEAALVAKAYGNANGIDALLDRLYETQDEGVRRVTNALRLASYKFAELRLSLDTERVPGEYDVSQDVINAYNFVREGRARGMGGKDFLQQGDLTASANQDAIVRMFYKPDGTEQSTETIASQLIYYAQQANQQRLDQGGLFGGNETVLVPPDEILTSSLELIGDPHPTQPDKGSKFARQGQYRPGGMQAWGVKQLVDPIVARWNPEAAPRVRIVQDAGELPAEILAALGPNINGATDLNTGTVYLVANNLPDTWTAQRILAHEAVGHFGFDRLYGDRFEGMVGQIIALEVKDATIRKIGQTIDRHYENLDRSTRAAEIIAHLAETQPKHPLAKKIIAQFREILRALGFRINLSRNDLVYMIRRSADAMTERNPIQRERYARELKPGPMEKRGATSEANLIAQHNLSFNNLRHLMHSLGGKIPVPSIAITKVGTPMVNFGEVTLLGDDTLIDPRGPNKTKVFGADIYSPRYPKIQRFMNKGALAREFGMRSRRIQNAVAQAIDGFLDGNKSLRQAAEDFASQPEGLELYAIERREWSQERIDDLREEAISRLETETGVDRSGFSSNDNFYSVPNRITQLFAWELAQTDPANFLRTKVGKDVVNYLEYRLGKVDFKEKIFKGYDDRLGTRRYVEHTLDNVVKEMKRNLRGGESDTNIYGVGQVRAFHTPEFSSRRDITANKDRLVDTKTFESEKDSVENQFIQLANEMFGSNFSSLQNMSDFMVDVARGGVDYAYRKISEYNIPARDEPRIREQLQKLRNQLRDMPTEYFEAKITKPVELNQFKAAVVPDDVPTEIREFLEAAGIKIFEYDSAMPASYSGSASDYVKRSRKEAIELAARNTEGALFASRTEEAYQQLLPKYRAAMEKMDREIAADFSRWMSIMDRAQVEADKRDVDLRQIPEYRDAQDARFRKLAERKRMLANFRRWTERENAYREKKERELQGPKTDPYGRPLNEAGLPLDQEGRYIPEGQEELFNEPPPPAETPPLELEAPQGNVGAGPTRAPQITGQRGLFASRGATITEDLPLETPAQPVSSGPPAWAGPVKVGGGEYQLKQFGKLDQAELNVLHSVIGSLEAPIAEQRRGERSWTATEKAALDLVQQQYGVTLDGLVNRKPGSAANAEQLEAYGMMIGRVSSELKTLVDGMGRNPSSAELARLAELKERLGMLLAPAMGYQTEAGRALNILRKISGELRNADDILAAMGDGAEGTLKDFARRVREAGSIDQVVGLTKAAYSPTWWDKFYEYWINGLLSGPTTHSVNMVSNAVFQALESAAEFAAAPFSKDVSTRAAMARLAALPHGVTLGMANAKQAFLEERAILTPEDKLEGEHNKAIGGKAGKVVRLPGRMLQAEDEFFKATAYTGELAALAMEEAIRTNPADVMGEFQRIMGSIPQRPDLIKAAKKKAAQVTFTTPLGPNMAALSRVLNKSKVGRLIVPFIRTPTNILFEATKYTPAAPLLEQVRKDLSNGGRDAALGWSRMAIGSSIMLGFAAMAAQGILSGAGPDDDATRSQLMRQGWRPYSIKLPDGSWLKYNRFEPFGMLTGLAADLFEIGSSMSDGDYSAASSMLLTSLASNLGDKTFLRGVTEFSQAYADPKRYLSRWANGMLSSPVPNAIAQTTRWLDPYQREANTILDNYKAKLPGMSDQLAKRLDLAGDPIQRDTGMPGNPFATSTPKQDPLAAAMVKLGVRKNAPGKSLSVAGRNYRLAGEAYTSYKGYIQKARYQVLTPLVNSPQFRQLMAQNPTAAQALLEKQWDDVGRQARLSWLYKNPTALGNPVQAPGGKDLAGSYALN